MRAESTLCNDIKTPTPREGVQQPYPRERMHYSTSFTVNPRRPVNLLLLMNSVDTVLRASALQGGDD